MAFAAITAFAVLVGAYSLLRVYAFYFAVEASPSAPPSASIAMFKRLGAAALTALGAFAAYIVFGPKVSQTHVMFVERLLLVIAVLHLAQGMFWP